MILNYNQKILEYLEIAAAAKATRDAARGVGELVGGPQRVKMEIESNIVYDKKERNPRYKLAPKVFVIQIRFKYLHLLLQTT